MKLIDFLPHLKSMNRGYKYTRDDSPDHKWYRARTDDILAITSHDKLLLICLGTQPKWREWVWNILFFSTEWLNIGRVHGGFARNVEELLGREDQLDSLITECLISASKGKNILVEGHSRGYPIACLVATKLISHGVHPSVIKVVGCGGARVGNKRFNENYSALLGDRTFVLNGNNDPVPTQPLWGYTNGQVTKINLGAILKPKHLLKHYIEAIESNEKK